MYKRVYFFDGKRALLIKAKGSTTREIQKRKMKGKSIP